MYLLIHFLFLIHSIAHLLTYTRHERFVHLRKLPAQTLLRSTICRKARPCAPVYVKIACVVTWVFVGCISWMYLLVVFHGVFIGCICWVHFRVYLSGIFLWGCICWVYLLSVISWMYFLGAFLGGQIAETSRKWVMSLCPRIMHKVHDVPMWIVWCIRCMMLLCE